MQSCHRQQEMVGINADWMKTEYNFIDQYTSNIVMQHRLLRSGEINAIIVRTICEIVQLNNTGADDLLLLEALAQTLYNL